MHAGNNRASEKMDMTFAYALENLKFHNSVIVYLTRKCLRVILQNAIIN